eukprot:1195929-Prorocentrum_minimum.AAC.5
MDVTRVLRRMLPCAAGAGTQANSRAQANPPSAGRLRHRVIWAISGLTPATVVDCNQSSTSGLASIDSQGLLRFLPPARPSREGGPLMLL